MFTVNGWQIVRCSCGWAAMSDEEDHCRISAATLSDLIIMIDQHDNPELVA